MALSNEDKEEIRQIIHEEIDAILHTATEMQGDSEERHQFASYIRSHLANSLRARISDTKNK